MSKRKNKIEIICDIKKLSGEDLKTQYLFFPKMSYPVDDSNLEKVFRGYYAKKGHDLLWEPVRSIDLKFIGNWNMLSKAEIVKVSLEIIKQKKEAKKE